MLRYLVLLGAVSAMAIAWAEFVTDNPNALTQAGPPESATVRPAAAREETSDQPVTLSGVERLRADARGHHIAYVRINGTRVRGLIDTGATAVAINRTLARRAGIALDRGDFVHPVRTANGTVMAARAMLDDVSLGSIRVRDVEALVIEDDMLDMALIGMSFMGRLREFRHENGTLVLRR